MPIFAPSRTGKARASSKGTSITHAVAPKPDLFFNFIVMAKSTFTSNEELMQTYIEAKQQAKEADEQIDLCKRAFVDMEVPVNEPLWEGYGLIQKERKMMEVPVEVAVKYLGDDANLFMEINKAAFDKHLSALVEQEKMTPEVAEMIRSEYLVKSSTSYFEAKKL